MNDLLSQLQGQMRAGSVPMLGLAFATVNSVDEEGYYLEYRSGTNDAVSPPARVATMMAGDRRGTYFMPEVGDEVVVGFELGDLSRPVILGALWNDRQQPPEPADTEPTNNIRTIVSRGGHQITFDDSPAGKIIIKTHGGMEITLEDTPPKISIKTTGAVATSRIVLDGVAWNHQHATGSGPSGPPLSIVPVT